MAKKTVPLGQPGAREQLKPLPKGPRLDRLACSTVTTIKAIADKGCLFKSMAEPWADTTTPAGRLMLTVFARVGRVRTGVNQGTDERGPRESEESGSPNGTETDPHSASDCGSAGAKGRWRIRTPTRSIIQNESALEHS